MTDQRLESVSALMDGENTDSANEAIRELLRDEGARRTWGRYHMISECLRGAFPGRFDPGLAARIANALQSEPTVLAPAGGASIRYLKPLAGLAIAASVAAMAVLGIHANRGGTVEMQSSPAVAVQAPAAQPTGAITLASGHQGLQPARAQFRPGRTSARMNRYLVNYNEYRSNAAMQGMIPYVRIVTHENNE